METDGMTGCRTDEEDSILFIVVREYSGHGKGMHMSTRRPNKLVLERIIAALYGILSLVLLGLPFWTVSIVGYGWIDLSSGFQLALVGANPDLPNLVWRTFPTAYFYSYLPSLGSFAIPVIVFAWCIILGALLVQVMGFTAILFTQGEKAKKFGRLIALGGKFVLIGSLLTLIQVMFQLSDFARRYGGSSYSFVFYPGLALLVEPLLGIAIWLIGDRIRHTT
jgi:hypothetical protein